MDRQTRHTPLIYSILLLAIITFACADSRLRGDWAVPVSQISEGEGDGDIPAINNPKFTLAKEITFLTDSSIIIGIKINDLIRAYPLEILDWHEVVNDQFDDIPVAITYSALSGSSIALDRRVDDTVLEFRVSGLLYNSNTILSEFQTFSEYSQMLRQGIRGDFSMKELAEYPVFEMTWGKWKTLYPESEVMNRNTGFNRPYGTYPYGDYQTDTAQIFFTLPLNIDSLQGVYPLKDKVLGVKVGSVVKGYGFESFEGEGFSLVTDELDGRPIIVIGSADNNFLVAYSALSATGNLLTFSIQTTNNQILLTDNEGGQWTIFGESVENPSIKLDRLESNIAYFFTWATFYQTFEIFN